MHTHPMYLFILVTNLLYFMFTERWKPSARAKRHPRVIDIINIRDLPACCYQLTHDHDNAVHTWVTANLFIDSTQSILFKYTAIHLKSVGRDKFYRKELHANSLQRLRLLPYWCHFFESLSLPPRCMKKLKQEPHQEKRNEEIQIKSQETETPFCVIFDDKCSSGSFWRLEIIN